MAFLTHVDGILCILLYRIIKTAVSTKLTIDLEMIGS